MMQLFLEYVLQIATLLFFASEIPIYLSTKFPEAVLSHPPVARN